MRSSCLMMLLLTIGCGGNGGAVDMAGGNRQGIGTGGNGGPDLAGSHSVITIADMAAPVAAPVTLKNVSMRDLQNGGGYNLTFALVNNVDKNGSRAIERVDLLRMSWGTDKVTAQLGCTTPPWTNGDNYAITVNVTYSGSYTTFSYPCQSSQYTANGSGSQAKAPSGSVHIAFDGILADATPFTAEGDAPVK